MVVTGITQNLTNSAIHYWITILKAVKMVTLDSPIEALIITYHVSVARTIPNNKNYS